MVEPIVSQSYAAPPSEYQCSVPRCPQRLQHAGSLCCGHAWTAGYHLTEAGKRYLAGGGLERRGGVRVCPLSAKWAS